MLAGKRMRLERPHTHVRAYANLVSPEPPLQHTRREPLGNPERFELASRCGTQPPLCKGHNSTAIHIHTARRALTHWHTTKTHIATATASTSGWKQAHVPRTPTHREDGGVRREDTSAGAPAPASGPPWGLVAPWRMSPLRVISSAGGSSGCTSHGRWAGGSSLGGGICTAPARQTPPAPGRPPLTPAAGCTPTAALPAPPSFPVCCTCTSPLPPPNTGAPGDALGQRQRSGGARGRILGGPALPKVHSPAPAALWLRAARSAGGAVARVGRALPSGVSQPPTATSMLSVRMLGMQRLCASLIHSLYLLCCRGGCRLVGRPVPANLGPSQHAGAKREAGTHSTLLNQPRGAQPTVCAGVLASAPLRHHPPRPCAADTVLMFTKGKLHVLTSQKKGMHASVWGRCALACVSSKCVWDRGSHPLTPGGGGGGARAGPMPSGLWEGWNQLHTATTAWDMTRPLGNGRMLCRGAVAPLMRSCMGTSLVCPYAAEGACPVDRGCSIPRTWAAMLSPLRMH